MEDIPIIAPTLHLNVDIVTALITIKKVCFTIYVIKCKSMGRKHFILNGKNIVNSIIKMYIVLESGYFF